MAKRITELPVGSKVKDVNSKYFGASIVYRVLDFNHYRDELNPGIADHISLMTDKIICLKPFDAKEPNNSDSNRKNYGNNRYKHSNIRQWLNSDKEGWYEPQHSADEPPTADKVWSGHNPYLDEPGFLTFMSEEMKAALIPTNIRVAKNTVTDGGGSEVVTDRVFLLSRAEMGLGDENNITEGKPFDMFNSDSARQAYTTKEAWENSTYDYDLNSTRFYWMRTPDSGGAGYVRFVDSSGSLSNDNAYGGYDGVLPALNLSSDTLVSDTPDLDGVYTLIFAPPHKLLFKEENDIKIFQDGAWKIVGQSDDELGPIFEEFGMENLTGIDTTQLANKELIIQKEGEPPKINIHAIPYPQLVFPTGDIVFKMLDKIHYFKVYANQTNSGIVRIIFSVDSGDTWQTYNLETQEFEKIDITNMAEVREKGIEPDVFNAIEGKWNEIIESKIRFGYYIEQRSSDDVAEVDKLEIKMDLQGRWKKAKHVEDYDYEYDNEHIYVSFYKDGSYKINYQE